jgi:hypothetical protein
MLLPGTKSLGAMINCYACKEEIDTSIGSNGNSTGNYYNTGETVIAHGKGKR